MSISTKERSFYARNIKSPNRLSYPSLNASLENVWGQYALYYTWNFDCQFFIFPSQCMVL